MSLFLIEKYQINSLLISKCSNGSFRFFRVIDHTDFEIQIHQIVSFVDHKGNYKVNDKSELSKSKNKQGLATVNPDGTLLWRGFIMKLWLTNSFYSETDSFN